MNHRHAQAFRCPGTGPLALMLTSSLCGCAADATTVSATFPKNFWVVQCQRHPASGAACGAPLMAYGRRRVPLALMCWAPVMVPGLPCGRRWGGGAHGAWWKWRGGCALVMWASCFSRWFTLAGDVLLRNMRLPWTFCSSSTFPPWKPPGAQCHDVHFGVQDADVPSTKRAAKPQDERTASHAGGEPLTARRRRHRPRPTPAERPPPKDEAPENHTGHRAAVTGAARRMKRSEAVPDQPPRRRRKRKGRSPGGRETHREPIQETSRTPDRPPQAPRARTKQRAKGPLAQVEALPNTTPSGEKSTAACAARR